MRSGSGFDIIIVGGGLSAGLLADRLAFVQPELRTLVLEAGESLGGNHTWSFHGSDLTASQLEWVRPLVSREWPGYEVRFQGLSRELPGSGYYSVQSTRFHEVLSERLGDRVQFRSEVRELRPDQVVTSDGRTVQGACVIDARGFSGMPAGDCGFQKFVGLDLVLEEPHGIGRPVLMDALCEQKEGFRFFYLLPWSENEILIEDTRYSASSLLDVDSMQEEIRSYASGRDWKVRTVKRVEKGVLPIPLSAAGSAGEGGPVPRIGVRGGHFQRTTGYSFASAVRLAEVLAPNTRWSNQAVGAVIDAHRRSEARRDSFYCALNRMLFLASTPERRVDVIRKFYQLPEELIERFYAGRSTWGDALRILSGRPPVPVLPAVLALASSPSGRKSALSNAISKEEIQ